MRRILLRIAYDGTAYHGWQKQENTESIEGCILEALSHVLPGENPVLYGASRTDAGVHALGNAASFDTESRIPGERFARALNTYLPEDIRVTESVEVPADFHPRFTPHRKDYCYRIDRRQIPSPLNIRYAYSFPFPLDVERMRKGTELLLGEHDFMSFVNPDSQVLLHGGDAVRTIFQLDIREEGEELCFLISGNGFLYHMIRIIVGTLLRLGTGKLRPEEIEEILLARDRRRAGPTVPAKGLCLLKLEYEGIGAADTLP